ncbi:MAG: hypothetical protein V1678_03120 [Candidatus Aenigmatarchaeota archaeon]
MLRPTVNTIFYVLVIVALVLVAFYFMSQVNAGIAKSNEYMSNVSQEKEETVEDSSYRALGITVSDVPEIAIYKFFRNFDSSFYNETNGNKIKYNPFILDITGKTYNILSGSLTRMTADGLKNFSLVDRTFQIGADSQQPVTCDIKIDSGINYNNDCWSPSMESNLSAMPSATNPCKIYINSSTSNFDGKVKFRVGWYMSTSTSYLTNRKIIYTLITMCDG